MTSREELIEEAAKAMQHDVYSGAPTWDGVTEGIREDWRNIARAALAVFEKAHAPTDMTIPRYAMLDLHAALYGVDADFDAFYEEHGYAEAWSRLLGAVRELSAAPTNDEREVKRLVEFHGDGVWRDETGTIWVQQSELVNAIRRSEVPEPSTEVRQVLAWIDRTLALPMYQGGELTDYADATVTALRTVRKMLDGSSRPDASWRSAEPQGEPSDARVEAGCAAFYEGAQGLTSWARLVAAEPELASRYRDGIRAALRAAGGVR